MGGIIPGETENRITRVFTNRSDRGNGYASMLITELCEETLKQGKTLVLYADADYPSSNRAYTKIGFINQGDLYNVKIGTAKMKKAMI